MYIYVHCIKMYNVYFWPKNVHTYTSLFKEMYIVCIWLVYLFVWLFFNSLYFKKCVIIVSGCDKPNLQVIKQNRI